MIKNVQHIATLDSPPAATEFSKEDIVATTRDHSLFEQQYLALRKKENRLYADDELLLLPEIAFTHPHYHEWQVRKTSYKKLKNYLENRKKSFEILEIGCGNGWLANQLSIHINCQVIGVDINQEEMEQASRVFRENTECSFLYGDIRSGFLTGKKFDIVIFAASIQYFESLSVIINTAKKYLKAGGEIHIIDSHFYKEEEIEQARERSGKHFNSLGYPAMSGMYFHHSLNEVNSFNPVILHNPFSLVNRVFKAKAPFYWMKITNDQNLT